jgi:hypothetical protein
MRQVRATFASDSRMWGVNPAWIWRICHANVRRVARVSSKCCALLAQQGMLLLDPSVRVKKAWIVTFSRTERVNVFLTFGKRIVTEVQINNLKDSNLNWLICIHFQCLFHRQCHWYDNTFSGIVIFYYTFYMPMNKITLIIIYLQATRK